MSGYNQSELLSAAERLFQSGSIGFVVLDGERRIRMVHGKMAEWIELNMPALEVMPFLVGYEDMLAEVECGEAASFRLPHIALDGLAGSPTAALSVEIFRSNAEGGLGVLIRDESDKHDLERELLQIHNELALARREEQRLADTIRFYEHEVFRPEFAGFIGSSLRMQAVYRIIESAATSDATVFITGESGTGKELCAEAIHSLSQRHGGPFVPVNCAAIPRELIESELFGHVKGAFTGAIANRTGAAMQAQSGTLFLDEIGDMEFELQSKLLRFVQSRKIQRVGKSELEDVDTRIVCATNRDALSDVKAGRFREDLYYRLNVIPIELPPLREREGDVIQLSEVFLQEMSKREGKRFSSFSSDVKQFFLEYDWPGNVRELQNIIQRIVILNDASEVSFDMVPAHMHAPTGGGSRFDGQNANKLSPVTPLTVSSMDSLAQTERRSIEMAIARCNGNVRLAAHNLGISPATIYRKLAKWRDDPISRS